jgi:hypothetical protein
MIVKDKVITLHKAHEVSNQLLEIIKTESQAFGANGDSEPAEIIYLNIHIVAALCYKMCILLEGYGQTYGIPHMRLDMLHEWLRIVTNEHLESHAEE